MGSVARGANEKRILHLCIKYNGIYFQKQNTTPAKITYRFLHSDNEGLQYPTLANTQIIHPKTEQRNAGVKSHHKSNGPIRYLQNTSPHTQNNIPSSQQLMGLSPKLTTHLDTKQVSIYKKIEITCCLLPDQHELE